jgi:glycosyltransferase involved in cell wall biosynthesis
MKILIATDTYFPNVNGASYFTQRLAKWLNSRGHSVLVIAPSPFLQNHNYTHEGIRVCGLYSIPIFINDFRVTLPIFIKERIRNALFDFNPEIVHVQGHFFIGQTTAKLARSRGISVVGTNHFMPENLSHYGRLPKILTRSIDRMLWRHAIKVFSAYDFATSPSKKAVQIMIDHGYDGKIFPISNGVDLNCFHPGQSSLDRKKYGLDVRPILLFVGRIDKEKNVDLILRALPGALAQTNFQFIAAGKGAELDNLKKLARLLGVRHSANFLGFVPDRDLPDLYRSATAFVIACTAELQSIATMEAMASGLPVIAVDAVALPELIHNGKNGFLFTPGSVPELSKAIVNLFSDQKVRAKMAQRSLEIIQEHNINKTMQEFETLYAKLISKKV